MTMECYERTAPAATQRTPWNKGKLIGAKPPLRAKHVWSIRTKLQVEGRIRSPERAMTALGCKTYREIEDKLREAINRPIAPKYVKTSPMREVVLTGEDVDLYKLPIPMSSIFEGG